MNIINQKNKENSKEITTVNNKNTITIEMIMELLYKIYLKYSGISGVIKN